MELYKENLSNEDSRLRTRMNSDGVTPEVGGIANNTRSETNTETSTETNTETNTETSTETDTETKKTNKDVKRSENPA